MANKCVNKVILIGNLTRDPELRQTTNGTSVCMFSIATNRSYKNNGEDKEETEFHQIVAWEKLAELCNQFLKKGTRVYVEGRIHTTVYRKENVEVNGKEIIISEMIVLDRQKTEDIPI